MTAGKCLTAERLRQLLHYNPETGVFTNAHPRKKVRVGDVAGCATGGRLVLCIDRRKYDAGQLAWLYMTGSFAPHQVDHEDRNPLNNKWQNLRSATNKQNQENRSIDRRNKSGFKGVHWHKQREKWCAQIRHNDVTHHLGLFRDLDDAIRARVEAESAMFTHGVSVNCHTTPG